MTAPTPDLDSMTARAVDRVHEDALADSRSLDKDDLTRLARYISDGFEAESDAALATVTAERDQARQMLADAPHGDDCVALNTLQEVQWPDLCDCWKAGL